MFSYGSDMQIQVSIQSIRDNHGARRLLPFITKGGTERRGRAEDVVLFSIAAFAVEEKKWSLR